MFSVEGKSLPNMLFLRYLRLLRLSYHNMFSAFQTSALIHFFSKCGRVTTYIIFRTSPKTGNRGITTFDNIPVAGRTTFIQLTFFLNGSHDILRVSGREPVPHHPLLLSSVLLAFNFLHTRGFTSPNPTRENDTKTLSFSTSSFQKVVLNFL